MPEDILGLFDEEPKTGQGTDTETDFTDDEFYSMFPSLSQKEKPKQEDLFAVKPVDEVKNKPFLSVDKITPEAIKPIAEAPAPFDSTMLADTRPEAEKQANEASYLEATPQKTQWQETKNQIAVNSNSFVKGLGQLGSKMARTPEYILDFFQQDPFVKMHDRLEEKNTGQKSEKWSEMIPNLGVAEYYDDKVAVYEDWLAQNDPNHNKSIIDQFKSGNWVGALNNAVSSTSESLPSTLYVMAGTMVQPEISIPLGISTFAAGKKHEMDIDPDAAHMDEGTKIMVASLNGSFEFLFERMLGSGAVAKSMSNIVSSVPKEEAKSTIKNIFINGYQEALTKNSALAIFGETYEEASTSIAQDMVDKYSGYKPDLTLGQIIKNAGDAAISAIPMGIGFAGIHKSVKVYNENKSERKVVTEEIENEISAIRNEETGNLHPIEHRLVKNEDGTNKQFFVVGNLDKTTAVVSDLNGKREVVSLRDAEELPELEYNNFIQQQIDQSLNERRQLRQQQSVTEQNQLNAAQFQTGQSIVYDGKQFTISEIQPDGSIVADDLTDENSSVLIPATDLGNITTTVDQKPMTGQDAGQVQEQNIEQTKDTTDVNAGQNTGQEDILGITEQPIGEQPTVDNGGQEPIQSAPVVSTYPIVLDNKPAGNAVQNPDGSFTLDTIYQEEDDAIKVKDKLVKRMKDEGYSEANFQVTSAKLEPNNPFSPKQYKVHIIPPVPTSKENLQVEPEKQNSTPERADQSGSGGANDAIIQQKNENQFPDAGNMVEADQVPEVGNMIEPVTNSNALESGNENDFVTKSPGELLQPIEKNPGELLSAPSENKEPWQMTELEFYDSNYYENGVKKARELFSQIEEIAREESKSKFVLSPEKVNQFIRRQKVTDFTNQKSRKLIEEQDNILNHKQLVKKAISEGNQVPQEVLKDYPDLQSNSAPVINETTKAEVSENKDIKPTEKNPGALLVDKKAKDLQSHINRSQAAKKRAKESGIPVGFPSEYAYVLKHDPRTAEEYVLQFIARGGRFKTADVERDHNIKEEGLRFVVKKDGENLDTFLEETVWGELYDNSSEASNFIVGIMKDNPNMSTAAQKLGQLINPEAERINPDLFEEAQNEADQSEVQTVIEEQEEDSGPFWDNIIKNGVNSNDNLLDDELTKEQENSEDITVGSTEAIQGEEDSDRPSDQGGNSQPERKEKNPGELLNKPKFKKVSNNPIVEDVYKDQIKVNGEWYATSIIKNGDKFKQGDVVPELMKKAVAIEGNSLFLNPIYVTEDKWKEINKQLHKQGFTQRPWDEWQQFFGKWGAEEITNPDHKKAIEKAFTNELNVKPVDNSNKLASLIKKAVKTFGLTTRFTESGYMLPDGRLLDFSGRHEGGDERSVGNRRYVDHRAIQDIDSDLVEFIALGNIRMFPESNGFEITQKPTFQQERKLIDYIESAKGAVYVDMSEPGQYGKIIGIEYPKGTNPRKIFADISRYYDEGIEPATTSGVRFRKAPLYSNTERALTLIQQSKGTPEQFKAMLLKNGAKQDELNWMDWDSRFANQKSVTKEEIQNWLDENKIEIKEVVKDDEGKSNDEENGRHQVEGPKYAQYIIPGGKNYREVLLTLPKNIDFDSISIELYDKTEEELTDEQFKNVQKTRQERRDSSFKSSHWNEPNIVAHLRMNEFTTKEGKRALNIEEIQSDFAQSGKKKGFRGEKPSTIEITSIVPEKFSYAVEFSDNSKSTVGKGVIGDNATDEQVKDYFKNILREKNDKVQSEYNSKVPDMPFKKTDQWVGLGMKWALRYAAENGFDVLTWTNGETQAERYDLSKQVQKIFHKKNNDGTYDIKAMQNGQNIDVTNGVEESKLPDIVGKDLAKKIIETPESDNTFGGYYAKEGGDLKVGGEGMKGFYDTILPTWTKNYVKKWGAKVGTTELDTNPEIDSGINTETGELSDPTSKKYLTVHSVEITPEMRESVLQGQPMFKNNISDDSSIDRSSPEAKRASIQKIFDDANQGAEIVVLSSNKAIIEDLKARGTRDTKLIKDLENGADFAGMYVPEFEITYIKPQYVNNAKQVRLIWVHENGIHFGIHNMLGDYSKQKELSLLVYNSAGETAVTIATQGEYADTETHIQGEEYLAFKAEDNELRGLIDNNNVFTIEGIDELLTKEKLTNEEINKLINTFVTHSENHATRENKQGADNLSGSERETGSEDAGNDVRRRTSDVQEDKGRTESTELRGIREDVTGNEGKGRLIQNYEEEIDESSVSEGRDRYKNYRPTTGSFVSIEEWEKRQLPEYANKIKALNKKVYVDKKYATDEDVSDLIEWFGVISKHKYQADNWDDLDINLVYNTLNTYGKLRNPKKEKIGFWKLSADLVRSGKIKLKDTAPPKFKKLPGQLLQNPNEPHPQIKKNSLDWLREGLQDAMLAVRKLQSKEGLTVDDISNIYLSDNQKNSRSMGQKEAFRKNYFIPFLQIASKIPGKNLSDKAYLKLDNKLKQGNVTVAEWEAEKKELDKTNVLRYMIAKHAPERNAYFKGLGKTGDNYAGMTDQEAAEVVAAFENMTTQEDIDNLWGAWNKATEEVMNMWVKYGRYDAKSLAEIKARGWKHYVPLRGWEPTADEIDWDYQSNGGRGEFSGNVKTMGRTSIADNPLASLENMAQSAILWGEKNRVKQAAYRLAKNNKTRSDLFYVKSVWNMKDSNGKVVEVIKEGDNFYSFDGWTRDGDMLTTLIGTQQDIEAMGSAVSHTYNSEHQSRKPKTLAGQHEIETFLQGRKYIVVFRDPNIANEINKIGITGPIPYIAPITRFKSKVVTSLNPVFVMKNMIRDFLGGGKTLFIEQDLKTSLQFAKNWGKAVHYVGRNMAGNESNKYAQYWKEYTSMGGRTGSTHLDSMEDIKSSIKKDIRKIQRSKVTNALINTVSIFKHLDTMAQYSENLARFASYVTAREQKRSMVQSINMAKEVTVNFDRKGKWGGAIGSFVQFFNASMQGADKQIMQMKNNTGKYFLATATSLAAQGFLVSMLYDIMSGDDDKEKDYKSINKYTRYNNFIYGFKDTYIAIPIAQGYRVWNAIGCIAYDLYMNRIDSGQASFDVTEAVMGSLSPVDAAKIFSDDGNGEISWGNVFTRAAGKLVSPVEPILQAIMNEDYKGDRISREAFTAKQEASSPRSQMYNKNTNPAFIALTDALFRLGGGDPNFNSKFKDNGEKVHELLDINPSGLEYIFKQYTGGVGTTFLNAVTAISQATMDEAEKTQLKKQSLDNSIAYDIGVVPVINGFYRSKYQSAANEEFKVLDKWHDRIDYNAKEAKKTMDIDRMVRYGTSPEVLKYREVGNIKDVLNDLYDIRKQARTIEQINLIDLQITQLKRNIVLKYPKK